MTAPPTLRPPGGDVALLRQVFGCFPSGVTAVCAMVDGQPVGMAASSFTSVSIDPPLVSVCVQNDSQTWPKLRSVPRIGLSVLAADQEAACRALSNKHADRFEGVDWSLLDEGAIVVVGAAAVLDCTLHSEMPAGDHAIALLEIHHVHADLSTTPLVFHGSRFRRLVEI
jgi:flavin reductase (DIM6/NTAB) family NADH-FMN oxidoreductase RutF